MTSKKKIGFGGGLVIYITVMLTLVFVGVSFWWHYLGCYEGARTEGVMDRYMTRTLTSDLEQEIQTYSIAKQTAYQSASEVSSVLTRALSGDDWYYREDSSRSTAQRMVYTLYCGDLSVGEVVLSAGESKPIDMGFDTWMAPKATFDFAQFGDSVTVVAPFGCTVYLSGEPLGEDDVTQTIGLYPQLEQYESLITTPNQLLVYEVGEVFTDVAVEFSTGYTTMQGDWEDAFYGLPVCEDQFAESLIDYCKNFVRAYVEYTANANSLWNVQQYLVPDSALYQELTQSSSGLDWGHGVHAVIDTMDVKNFVYYGNVITCEASYAMTRDDGNRSEVMRILLENTNLGWRVVTIEIIQNETARSE